METNTGVSYHCTDRDCRRLERAELPVNEFIAYSSEFIVDSMRWLKLLTLVLATLLLIG